VIDLGKRAWFLSFTLLVILILVQILVPKHLSESQGIRNLSQAGLAHAPVVNTPEENQTSIISEDGISLSEILNVVDEARLRHSKPIAIVSVNGLHYVDRHGYVVSPPSSSAKYNLPIISGTNITVDPSELLLIGESWHEALVFIHTTKKASLVLYNKLSHISVHDSLGLVVQLHGTPGLNAIIGRGQIERKIAYLAIILEKIGDSELLARSRYLDFRFRNQVVVKKKA
jgi:hypothetical protein